MLGRALVMLAAVFVMTGAALAYDGPDADRNPLRREYLRTIPLEMRGGRFANIREIVVRRGAEAFQVDAGEGVDRTNQSRVRLNDIPFLGQLFEYRFSRDDLRPERQVGAVYRDGPRLVVDIDPVRGRGQIRGVVVLNQDFAYYLSGRFAQLYAGTAPAPLPADAQPIGRAFPGEGGILLLLIEPSVLTNTIL